MEDSNTAPTPSSQILAPLIVIVGQTASGKSDLAMQIARQYQGEIICADSRTVYKGMDIVTAKPSTADQAEVRHHLIDIVEPGESFSVAQFKVLANKAVSDIIKRGKVPILVGGSGLYIDSVLFDYQFRSVDYGKKLSLEQLTNSELRQRAKKMGFSDKDLDFSNNRRLIRAIETGVVVRDGTPIRKNTLVVGLRLSAEELDNRIKKRVDDMIGKGLVAEIKTLADKYGWDSEAMTGVGYRAFRDYTRGTINLETAKQQFVKGDKNLARRQLTWFKRNKSIQWSDDSEHLIGLVDEFLTNS